MDTAQSFFQSVRATNSSRISCNRCSRREWSPVAPSLFLPPSMYSRFASLICAISSRNLAIRSLIGLCMAIRLAPTPGKITVPRTAGEMLNDSGMIL